MRPGTVMVAYLDNNTTMTHGKRPGGASRAILPFKAPVPSSTTDRRKNLSMGTVGLVVIRMFPPFTAQDFWKHSPTI